MIERVDQILKTAPGISTCYRHYTARIKREACMMLHRAGLLKPFTFVQWLATYGCNFSCAYCEASAGMPARDELTTGEAFAMVEDIAAMGVKRLAVSGGEPLVRKDITSIMSRAHDSGLSLGLVSNGYFVEELWDDLRHFNYFLYYTSIDGMPEQHDRTRKADSFARVMKSLELFSRKEVGTRIINSVVHAGNIDQLQALFALLKDSGATSWRLVPILAVGRAEDNQAFALDGAQLRELAGFIKGHTSSRFNVDFGEACAYLGCFIPEWVGNPFFCGAGLTRCAIMPDGEVLGCQTFYDNRFSEGNIRNKPFSRIWKEEFARFRQDRKFSEQCVKCGHFNACQGGCSSTMILKNRCLKSTWESTS
jgi:radical SAM protein with 4Fe4S-binding SPASM domain